MNANTIAPLVKKYNVPVPRYTSYPTVPYWPDNIDVHDWKKQVSIQFEASNHKNGISLYIHLPFCESLCTYCGCNKKITTNHRVESPYITALLQEWELYLALFNDRPVIREIHLGGGTPTYFSPANLDKLLSRLKEGSVMHPQLECSFEGHPNNTTPQHLATLHSHGFRRVSYGVQDNDPHVQHLINRVQPWENVVAATAEARKAGYQSVNFDLIYGLPGQTLASMEKTIAQVLSVRPDRIAFYSYAHVPWTSRGQRLFNENDLPGPAQKMELYLLGKQMFMAAGYADIGMDHFSLPGEALYEARAAGNLHRNFMGYTTQNSGMVIGLGVSSISDAGAAYAQNHKAIKEYYEALESNEFPVFRGCILNAEDVRFKKYILDITCKGYVTPEKNDMEIIAEYSGTYLRKLEEEGLIEWSGNTISVTQMGTHFLRNIARAFDLHLLKSESKPGEVQKFSKAI